MFEHGKIVIWQYIIYPTATWTYVLDIGDHKTSQLISKFIDAIIVVIHLKIATHGDEHEQRYHIAMSPIVKQTTGQAQTKYYQTVSS